MNSDLCKLMKRSGVDLVGIFFFDFIREELMKQFWMRFEQRAEKDHCSKFFRIPGPRIEPNLFK